MSGIATWSYVFRVVTILLLVVSVFFDWKRDRARQQILELQDQIIQDQQRELEILLSIGRRFL
jgi:hypothetical protein